MNTVRAYAPGFSDLANAISRKHLSAEFETEAIVVLWP